MSFIPRVFCLLFCVFTLSACADGSHRFEGSNAVVEVLETPPPDPLVEPTPEPLTAIPAGPTLIYSEPLPMPVRHAVQVVTLPAGATALDDVQSIEVEVEVEGGSQGDRVINAVFVTPQGVAWEKQGTVIAGVPGGKALAHFSLPVAATFIADHRLSGTWRITTLDEGVEQSGATFALED